MAANPTNEPMPSVGISGKEHTADSHQLERRVSWKSAAIISMGGSILVAVSLGPMAADLGATSIFVWILTALIGVANCLMICEMAGMFPYKSGGGAVYAHEAFKKKSPFPGAIAASGVFACGQSDFRPDRGHCRCRYAGRGAAVGRSNGHHRFVAHRV